MATEPADGLVLFQDVMVIRSTPPALYCRIGNRNVWLSRVHISGKLWCTGDRGKLYIRRWVARERHLIDPQGVVVSPLALSVSRPHRPAEMRLVAKHHDVSSR